MEPSLHLEQLVAEHYARIRRAAGLLVGNPHEADDLAQETFVQATLSWRRYRGEGDPFVWLYGILLNMDRKRRRRLGVWLRNIGIWLDLRSTTATAAEGADREDTLWHFVRQLPAPQNQAIVLRFGEGLSYAEIARIARCPEGTAKSRVFHGLKALRELIRAQGYCADSFIELHFAYRAGAAWASESEQELE